ncbi:MAG TPA: SDR family NAD(P)-dependent oxidoreductase [Polyangia bacterium]|nr:SDR family NAD(P)-dependent oxidoreductase [Polyangia bacterium]
MEGASPLAGKVVLVTGASSGIGRSVARMLSGAGVKIGLLARRMERLAALELELAGRGGEVLCLVADLLDEEQALFALRALERRFGGIDVLVNSAGLGHVAPLRSGTTLKLREMLEVNVLALSVLTREVVRSLEARGAAGHIVHVSSMSAYRVQGEAGMYAATKHAVRALTEGLRQELRAAGSPIRVSAVSPADTATEFMERMLGAERAGAVRPAYRQLDPEDVARAVLFVLSQPPHVEIHDILLRPTNQPD